MRLEAIPVGKNPPEDVNVVIEVPIGGEPIKYEMDKEAGTLVVDRFLYTSMRYPGNYGFIPHTLSGDGDPCDVLVANTRAIVPGAVINVRPIGVLLMEDDGGQDEKIVAVPTTKLTRRYENVASYKDMPEITIQQIEHFFAHYKDLEPGKWVKILHWADADEAKRIISEAIERAKSEATNPSPLGGPQT
ncbi:inorganic diphosphatase [Enterovirga aerilata]|uniref:Inorganic pyrophosphatase n=1 Tax=Enterovirga aerilata TaxID=2730920 RepID=A0A849I233_9HYPH|nr:inorganic diphosphatase [Enterovirga sp. DB1703]NNM71674.1 inorganic diphosphatase [Enterovirga sp. DB1703]